MSLQYDELWTTCRRDHRTMRPRELLTTWPRDHVITWPRDHVTWWPRDHVTTWPCDQVTSWPRDHVCLEAAATSMWIGCWENNLTTRRQSIRALQLSWVPWGSSTRTRRRSGVERSRSEQLHSLCVCVCACVHVRACVRVLPDSFAGRTSYKETKPGFSSALFCVTLCL